MSYKLIEVLQAYGFGVTGTCRTNLGVILKLVNIKKNDKGINKLLSLELVLHTSTLAGVCTGGRSPTSIYFECNRIKSIYLF
jgi:hypothetical protein